MATLVFWTHTVDPEHITISITFERPLHAGSMQTNWILTALLCGYCYVRFPIIHQIEFNSICMTYMCFFMLKEALHAFLRLCFVSFHLPSVTLYFILWAFRGSLALPKFVHDHSPLWSILSHILLLPFIF